ncbi:LapA family protein [Fredinandcohnia sp. FSL W7-1320]|uniref:LapA family protein n=1 Tax=Fredinandcohnia sp. FSL W7-1320 TaxID=2954540 RepID=UPI0030FDA828
MRFQWNLILGLLFALIVAIFAVVNVDSVRVNYVFGYSEIPLILIILGSALLGGLIVGMFGILRQYRQQRQIKKLEKEIEQLKSVKVEEKPVEKKSNDSSEKANEDESENQNQ